MDALEKLIETAAADLVMADVEDLPALAAIHEHFLNIERATADKTALTARLATAAADLMQNIILSEVADKAEAMAVIGESIAILQGLVRGHRREDEVDLPAALGMRGSKEAGGARRKTVHRADPPTEAGRGSLLVSLENSDTSLLGEFITEAREHCANAEQMMMNLESGGDRDAAINAIFRSFHTIKGAAGFLDLKPVLVLAHDSETLLDLARKGTVIVCGQTADLIFDAIDAMRKLLDGVEAVMKSGEPFDGAAVTVSVLERLRSRLENPETDDERCSSRVGDILIDMGAVSQKQIDRALEQRARKDEKLGETLVREGVVPAKAVAHALREQQLTKKTTSSGAVVKEMVKIDTERLDRLIDTIGELVVAESMVGQDEEILRLVSPKVARNVSHLNKITRELQEMGMSMRLVPVRATYQKLARAVRDLTRKSGKEIELELSGEETEVDRSIVEHIGDPLMHMVRNSVDHGIEPPEERAAAGKPRAGRITIRAYHKGGNIHFDVCDDGRGLDRDRILAKARERGLIDGGKEPTDHEIYNLILLPGFSTAQKVTDISGRGVGMDVVKKNIELMRGHMEIASTPGMGTTFHIKLPLTLAIIDGMLVKVEDQRFIIPTLSIVESLSLSKETVFTVNAKARMINLRGELLPLIAIGDLFGIRPAAQGNNEKTVVVVEDATRRVGFVVDTLLGQRQTVIKSLGRTFAAQKWVAGGAILSDGSVGLILDVSGMVALTGTHRAAAVDGDDVMETTEDITAVAAASV